MIESRQEILEANIVGLKIHYNVTIPIQAPLPRLKKLLYNGKSICSDDNNDEYNYNRAIIIRLSHSYSISSQNSKLMTSSTSVIMSKRLAAAT